MQCTYCYHDKERKYRNHFCFKKDGVVKGSYYHNYCSNSNYETCPIYNQDKESNCFFETILCEKMHLPEANHILENLTNFRKNTLEQDEKYRELLVIHDRISPIIADAIRNTSISSIDEFLKIIYSSFIAPINKFIIAKETAEAVERYEKMLKLLIVNFSLGQRFADIKYYCRHPEQYKSRVRIKSFF